MTIRSPFPLGATSMIRLYAEKMGVAREDGGTVAPKKPRTKAEQDAADEEEIRKFLGPEQPGVVRYDRDTTVTEAERARDARFANYEGERAQRLAIEQATLRARQAAEAEAEAAYQAVRNDGFLGPVRAWAMRKAGAFDVLTPEQQKQREEEAAVRRREWGIDKLMDVHERGHSPDSPLHGLVPERAKPYLEAAKPRREARQPVSFERDTEPVVYGPPPPPARADGGEIVPLGLAASIARDLAKSKRAR